MKRFFLVAACLIGLLPLFSGPAKAADSTFVVLPFNIQGPQGFAYLERNIPQMLTSRLYWKDKVVPAVHDLPAGQKPVADEKAAEAARVKYKADYVVWGSVTIMGDDCSLDVRVRDKAGKVSSYPATAKANQLIASIKTVSDSINRDLFNRKPAPSAAGADAGRVNQMNPDIMVNENTPKEVYLNPQFRYAGGDGDDSRIRSQALPVISVGMEVIDVNRDGKNEIVILTEHTLNVYRFEDNKLTPLGEYKLPATNKTLSLRALPIRNGLPWLVVNMLDSDDVPAAAIFTFDGKFTMLAQRIKFFLNVVKLPPDYMPALVGQPAKPPRLFTGSPTEMIKVQDGLAPAKPLALPSGVNALNFTYIPAGKGEKDGEKLLVLSGMEHLQVYTAKGSAPLSETEEAYSGAAAGINMRPELPGLGKDTRTLESVYYMPMRMPVVDLDRDGNWEVLVNKPISTASTIFDRYRFFPQGEIHSLSWDGIGLNLNWKTRRIKGSVTDFAVEDGNNDGVPDLVVCLNTHPGAIGVKERKTMVVMYPLDLDRTDPATPASKHDLYE